MTIIDSLSLTKDSRCVNLKTNESKYNNKIIDYHISTNFQSSNNISLYTSNFSQTIFLDKKPLPTDPALKCNIL